MDSSYLFIKIILKVLDVCALQEVSNVYELMVYVGNTIVVDADNGTAIHSGLPITTGSGFTGKH